MTSTIPIGDAVASLMREGMPVRFEAYDGSVAGPADADITLRLLDRRGLAYLLTAPGDLGMARAYVSGDLRIEGVHPGDPYDAMTLLQSRLRFRTPSIGEAVTLLRGLGLANLKPPPPPPQEHLPRWRRVVEGVRHSLDRDAEVISHHYDVSNAFYRHVLGPSMAYTCAVYPTPAPPWRRPRPRSSTWSAASSACDPGCACSTSAAAGAGWCGTRRSTTGCTRWA